MMSSAEYSLRLQGLGVQVTLEDVQKVSRPFVEGDSNGSAYEELVLAIERKLRSLIKRPKKHEKHDRYKSIAILVKILTQGRTVDQARDYLKSKENANFLSELVIPKAPTEALRMTNDVSAPENPTIAIAEPDPVVLADVAIDSRYLHANLPTDAFATSPEGSTSTAGPIGTVEFGVPVMAQPLLPRSPHRSSAHSRTPSDVSIDSIAERCPRCNQIHTNNLSMLLDILQQVLEQYGCDHEGPRPSRVASDQQFHRARNGQTASPMNVVSGHSTAIAGQQSDALLRDPPQRQRLSPDAISLGLVFVLLAFLVEVLPRLLSKWN